MANVGDTARVIVPVVQGAVTDVEFDSKTGAKRVLLAWTDGDNVGQERWFKDDELEVVTPAPAPEPDPA